MKRTLICALMLTAMIVTGVFLDLKTLSVTSELSAELDVLGRTAGTLLPEERHDRAKKLSGKWESFCADNIFLTNIEGAAEISGSLVRMVSCSRSDERQFAEECRTAAQLVEIYNDSRAFIPANIF